MWHVWHMKRYRAVTSAYYRGALGAMLVYDVTKRATFDHVAQWLDELRSCADPSIVVLLVGNKTDLTDRRAVMTDNTVEFAEKERLFFFETSALSGQNVEAAFFRLLEQIYGVVSKKATESITNGGSGTTLGVINGGKDANVIALRGTKIDLVTTASETSELKKGSLGCSCLA